jgi:DNA modification methylase
MEKYQIKVGDNIQSLKKLPDNSIDSVVTDGPYGLSFMNKKWDYDVPSVEFWKEVYRVLKPGGHILSFGGTRTYHRMVVNIEDAGFEIRDQIMWLYGSGFPKSHNISKKIEQEIDNLIYNNIWKSKLDNVKIAEPTLKKSQIEVGSNIEKQGSVQENVVEKVKEKLNYQNVIVVEKSFIEAHHILKDNPIVQESVGQFTIQQQELVRCVEQLNEDQIVKLLNIFIVGENVKDMLNESLMNKTKVEEVLRILNGEEKFSVLEIIPVLCVILPKILKHIILSQSRTFQNLDTKSQMDYVSATSVTITKSIMEHLIGNTVNILRKRIDFIIDAGHTALKPSNEPICLARKPLSEKSVAENVLKWGTGGINIDGCRVGSEGGTMKVDINEDSDTMFEGGRHNGGKVQELNEGRFPANIILECICDEVIKGEKGDIHINPMCPCRMMDEQSEESKGGTSRFFYQAKVSKKERNMGLDHFEEKKKWLKGGGGSGISDRENVVVKNTHPTVKPVQLMSYLCRLITPPGGTILDPYMGSGSTGIATLLEGFNFIGMEMDPEYAKIAESRISNYEEYKQFLKK